MVKQLVDSLKALLGSIQSDPDLLSNVDLDTIRTAQKALERTDIETIRCFLDISSGHLPEVDRKALELMPEWRPPFYLLKHDYGWRLLVPCKNMLAETPEAMAGFSPAFTALLDHARERDCFHINLDRDAAISPSLAYFEG